MAGAPRLTRATLAILDVFLGPDVELYGLRIAQRTGLATGSIYPILARLERLGWVSSEWEPGDPATRGPRRRFYRLTGEGLIQARRALDRYRRKTGRSIQLRSTTGPATQFPRLGQGPG
jgi:PadR family transcriptional regulator, regulatory protein PadR